MKEKLFETQLKQYLKDNSIWYVKYWGGGEFTKAGIPDLICCINGIFVAIEVKASNGRPSELQKYEIEEIKKSNGIAFVLYPKDFEKFKRLVEAIQRCNIHTHELSRISNALINTS